MKHLHRLTPLLLMLAVANALADSRFLDDDDVYFTYRPVAKGSGMCGFQIRGNHMSRKVPRPEWDINIDQIVAGDTRVAGVSAGAFDVTSNDKTIMRNPRPPISLLSFTVKGDVQPINTKLVGTPNSANAIRGVIDSEPATRLFEAFRARELITISLTYQDGTTDTLQVRGWNDLRKFGGGKNNFFDECLRGIAPYSNIQRTMP
jgi:hypothetical protein